MSTTRIIIMATLTSSRRLGMFVGACMLMFMTPTMADEAHVVYAYGAEAVNLDAADAIDGPSFDVVYNIHEGLVGLSETGEIVPVLATSWSLSDDRLSWTFNLREGVKFHDGTDFNADVVKFNFDRVMDAANELANVKQWEPHIASVEVVDAFTVKINTKKPYGSLLSLLASDFGKLMNSPDAVAQHGDKYGRNPIGTGPFMFESWTPGVKLVLKKNPDYWGGAPAIGSVEYRPSPEGSARVLALESGDVDLINQVPAQDLARLRESDKYGLSNRTISRLFYWAFNHTKDVWSDPRDSHRAEPGRRPAEHRRQCALRRRRGRQFLHLPDCLRLHPDRRLRIRSGRREEDARRGELPVRPDVRRLHHRGPVLPGSTGCGGPAGNVAGNRPEDSA